MSQLKRASISVMSLLALLLLAGNAQARTQGQPDQPQQDEAQANTPPGNRDLDDEKLNLSAEQKNQIKKIRDDAKSQAQAVRDDTSLTPEQRREKMRQIHRDANKQIGGVLTPEQRKIWHDRGRERRQYHRRRKPV